MLTAEHTRLEGLSLRLGAFDVQVASVMVEGLQADPARPGSWVARRALVENATCTAPLEACMEAARAHGVGSSRAGRPQPADAWRLEPVAGLEGQVEASITDAHWHFDADVRLPVRRGTVDFNQVAVEHVGPDSRMGVSRMGVYVDGPQGRTYLYQLPDATLPGVRHEQRGSLLGSFVGDRGGLELAPFLAGVLRRWLEGGVGAATTAARDLLARTSVRGLLQLGGGRFAFPGVEIDWEAPQGERNTLRLWSPAVGRGLQVELPALALAQTWLQTGRGTLRTGTVTGRALLQLLPGRADTPGGPRLQLDLPALIVTDLQADLTPAA